MSKSELLRVGVGGYGIYLLTSAFIAIPPMAKVFRNGLSGEHFLGLAEVLAIGLAGAALVSLAPVFEKWGEDPTDGITGNSDSWNRLRFLLRWPLSFLAVLLLLGLWYDSAFFFLAGLTLGPDYTQVLLSQGLFSVAAIVAWVSIRRRLLSPLS